MCLLSRTCSVQHALSSAYLERHLQRREARAGSRHYIQRRWHCRRPAVESPAAAPRARGAPVQLSKIHDHAERGARRGGGQRQGGSQEGTLDERVIQRPAGRGRAGDRLVVLGIRGAGGAKIEGIICRECIPCRTE